MASRRTKRDSASRPISPSPPPSVTAPATAILSSTLRNFRRWLNVNGAVVHSSLCIVNGEATDGTKNAPIYAAGKLSKCPVLPDGASEEEQSRTRIQHEHYAGSTGCTVRAVKEIKAGETALSVPPGMFVTPELCALSDAGRSILECLSGMPPAPDGPEDVRASNYRTEYLRGAREALARTAALVSARQDQSGNLAGNALLVNILRARKRAEDVLIRAQKDGGTEPHPAPADADVISDRSLLLAFLLHQRQTVGAPVQAGGHPESLAVPEGKGVPKSFYPYVLAMPPRVSLPISWPRTDLRMLSQSISGVTLLQETAAHTHVLSAELCALVNAGWLKKFEEAGGGKVTWEDWVWAAGVCMSRCFPVECLKVSESKAKEEKSDDKKEDELLVAEKEEDPWDDMGVMIPVLDMFNHEPDSAQIKWETGPLPVADGVEVEGDNPPIPAPRAVLQKRAKKGSVVYNSYGLNSNLSLVLNYGFAQVNNPNDQLGVGWGLSDAVGGVSPDSGEVHESMDSVALQDWWTTPRLALLRRVAGTTDCYESLRMGRKLHVYAYNDGHLHPLLLNVAVVATMPTVALKGAIGGAPAAGGGGERLVPVGPTHLKALQNYLIFFLTRKLEKLLSNLDSSIKTNYQCNLWTKCTEGGLNYKGSEAEGSSSTPALIGWQQFFDMNGYNSAMEVEKKYYAVGPDSCVLALFDGHVRAIQKTIDGVTGEKFENVLPELKEMGFIVNDNDEGKEESEVKVEGNVVAIMSNGSENLPKEGNDDLVSGNDKEGKKGDGENLEEASSSKNSDVKNGSSEVDLKKEANESKKDGGSEDKEKKKMPQDRGNHDGGSNSNKKGKKSSGSGGVSVGGNRPAALKLHIGNLAYCTLPSNLFDYFAEKYGKDNVLECHIPIERETGKSRGFGFVTMPETIARGALAPDQKHEVDGRLLKVAESNTAGSNRRNKGGGGGGNSNNVLSDRCTKCGYRPKYCNCAEPMVGGGGYPHQHPPRDFGHGPYNMPHGGPWYPDHYGDWRGPPPPMGWNYGRRSYSRSPSPYGRRSDMNFRGGGGGSDRYDDYDRLRRRRSYDSRSRSPSYSYGRDKDRNRGERKRHRGSSRRSRSRSRSRSRYSHSRSVSRSRSYRRDSGDRGDRRDSGGEVSRRGRGGSRSRSQSRDRKKRRRSDHRSRSRTRSRSKDRSKRDSGRRKRDRDISRKEGKRGRSWSKDRSRSKSPSRSKA